MNQVTRRSFFRVSAAGVLAGGAALSGNFIPSTVTVPDASAETFKGTLKKSMYWGMLPVKDSQGKSLSVDERFALMRRIGLDGVEIPTLDDSGMVAEFKAASEKNGVLIHSIMNQKHWEYPFSSSDPETIKTGMQGMETSLRNAKELGADAVLLVPAVVSPETSYRDAYERSRIHINELLPLAKELNVVIAIENVWNKFLLSPLEFARYVDDFKSPFLRAYFDVGNIVLYGYPQDWIRTLGNRIVKVHVKGFDANKKEFTNLGDGTIDWLEVRRAFSDIGYNGFINAELGDGDEAYLTDVTRRMDNIIAGRPVK